MRVAIIGTGYVGLTTGAALACLGHEVTGVDKEPEKLSLLQQGRCPIHEIGLQELMERTRERLQFTEMIGPAVADADVIILAVGTPSRSDGNSDTGAVEEAALDVAETMGEARRYTLVVKSTVPVGTNRRVANLIQRILRQRNISPTVHIASNPEFLREGHALHDLLYPDRIVVGAEDQEAVDVLRRLYRPILEQTFDPPDFLPRPRHLPLPPLISTDPTSAELIKYAANGFLALKISFINDIAGLCERLGADVTEVARGVGLDPRIGPQFLQAGLGWGGSCLPKDTAALLAMAREHSFEMLTVEAAREVNFRQRLRAVEKLQEVLKGVRGRIIGVLGLAFKPGTDDVRDSPALDVIRLLLERGALVRAHDPVATKEAKWVLDYLTVEFCADPYAVAGGADALILATEWPEYRGLDLQRLVEIMRTPVLLDGRNVFSSREVRETGLIYLGLGR